jgi:undecaprenyl diphosphate synthase
MDGNGRWAKARNLPRTVGHQRGIESVKQAIESAIDFNIEYLTLFGFSTENWNRPADEILELMKLLRQYLKSETANLHKNNIRLRVIGDRTRFDQDIANMIMQAETLTQNNTKLNLTIALNYGGRQDILNAVQLTIQKVQNQKLSEPEITTIFQESLWTADLPDPDLLIRTSGEQRISNFLIWSCAYTEYVFTDTLWPDFTRSDFEQALSVFAQRDRRFGGVESLQKASS